MDKNQTVSGLSMAERREKGLLWIDTGENLNQQVYARGLCQEFNQTRRNGKKEGNLEEAVCFLRRGYLD